MASKLILEGMAIWLFILNPSEISRPLAGQKVIVCDYPDGRVEIMHETFTLPYRTFDTLGSV